VNAPAVDVERSRDASSWREWPAPRAWRAYAAALALLSAPFFVRGVALLVTAPVDSAFLAALYVLLLFGNGCMLELPPYRFLHLVTGLVTFSGFFIAGPAVLGLLALSIKPSELGLVWLRSRLDPEHELPLGAKPAEYIVPASAVGLALGLVDLLRGPLGLVYPLRPADFAREVQFFTLLACLYGTVIVLIETGTWLRFGWQRAFGTRPVRADLVVYLLVILLGVPIVSASVRAYGPWPLQGLLSLGWMLWGFGFFVVAAILIRRRLEIERLVTVVARQERLAALGSLASIIAHQTRHHLGVLNMSAYVLGETLAREPLSPSAREAVSHELEALARTRAELDKLLAEELRGGGETERFGLLALAGECAGDIQPLSSTKPVTVSCHGEEREVRGDRLRLKQALTNLLRNAVEATPRGGEVTIEVRAVERDVCLTVRDQGPGLSPSARSRLFEPLFTEKGDGLGMGLYVARAIVEAHGGRIVLASEGRGTEAEIRLPVTS
jgi:signal transduction histidine kinase